MKCCSAWQHFDSVFNALALSACFRSKSGPWQPGDWVPSPSCVHMTGMFLWIYLLYHMRFPMQCHVLGLDVPESSASHDRVKVFLEVAAVFWAQKSRKGKKEFKRFPPSVFLVVRFFFVCFSKIIFEKNDTLSWQPNKAEIYEENHDTFVTPNFKKMQPIYPGLTILWMRIRLQLLYKPKLWR